MQFKTVGLAAVWALALAVPAGAHHSHGNYDLTKWVFLEGVVTELHFLAPHSIVYLEVKDEKGEVTTWSMEANGARGIFANGVKREEVRPGDRVKVRCFQLRDGSPGCLLGFVTPQHGDPARGHGVERDWT
jgi:hypothetical protein